MALIKISNSKPRSRWGAIKTGHVSLTSGKLLKLHKYFTEGIKLFKVTSETVSNQRREYV